MPRLPDWIRRRPLLWLALLVDFLLFTGPVVLVQAHQWWCERQGITPPTHYAFVSWMLLAGVGLLGAMLLYDLYRRLK